MIAIAKATPQVRKNSNWQIGFLAMMPRIIGYARGAFSHLNAEARGEAIQEVLVSTMLAYLRLYERGKVELAYPSVLARYAIAQYRTGRRVGEKMNCRDVLSPYARRMKGIQVESLRTPDCESESWRDLLVEDKHAGPAETAAARLDVSAWFDSLTSRDRQIAEALSNGTTTTDVANRFHLSPGRISQKRREFLESWQAFQGEQQSPEERGLCS